MRILLAQILLIASHSLAAFDSTPLSDTPDATLTVRITAPDDALKPRDNFYLQLAEQALRTALPNEALALDYRPEPMRLPQQRMLHQLREGKMVDIAWTMTSEERERTLIPVRVPLLRGLIGYRVLVVRQDELERFQGIDSIDDFKGLVGGQLQDWPDIEILRANQLPQMSALTLEQLYQLLRAERIDYVPRGITEVGIEQDVHDFDELAVVPSPVLRYPAPIYFFVSPARPEIATALKRGLTLMQENGQLQRFLNTHPNTAAWFTETQRWQERQFIDLHNPKLSKKTPLEQTQLWFNPGGEPWPKPAGRPE